MTAPAGSVLDPRPATAVAKPTVVRVGDALRDHVYPLLAEAVKDGKWFRQPDLTVSGVKQSGYVLNVVPASGEAPIPLMRFPTSMTEAEAKAVVKGISDFMPVFFDLGWDGGYDWGYDEGMADMLKEIASDDEVEAAEAEAEAEGEVVDA